MRSLRIVVKRLAPALHICHPVVMAKDAADKDRIKAERLREALRANLRRRKGQPDPAKPRTPDAAGDA